MSDELVAVTPDTNSMLDSASNMPSTTLLLTGRIGNGKSATGNSILGKKVFKPRSSSPTGPTEILKGTSNTYGKPITVLDGPDIDDVNPNSEDSMRSLFDMVDKILAALFGGITAIVLVLKYGVRFTKQEKDAVDWIRSVFGSSVLRKHGVIVMSHGDNFDLDDEDDGRSFPEWRKAQTGDVKSLFEECGSRVVLFNNKAGPEKMKEQHNRLMNEVSKIASPYTRQDFMDAEAERLSLLVKIKLPRIQKESDNKIDTFYTRLEEANYRDDVIPELQAMMRDLESHKQWLQREDEGTGVLRQLFTPVDTLGNTTQTRLNNRLRDSRKAQTNVPVSATWENPRPSGNGMPQTETSRTFLYIGIIVLNIISFFIFGPFSFVFWTGLASSLGLFFLCFFIAGARPNGQRSL